MQKRCGAASLAIHAGIAALLAGLSSGPATRSPVARRARVDVVSFPALALQAQQRGGGGGGERSPLRASRGKPPKAAQHQFVPPRVRPEDDRFKLIMEPTLVLPADLALPRIELAQYGDPFGKVGPPSGGRGSGSGIGEGDGDGVGPSRGPGLGPGPGGGGVNGGGGQSYIGRGVSANPVLLFKIEPEYTDEARKARLQGTVVLAVEVDASGRIQHARVAQSLGLGLDERALEAVAQWRFRPARRDGKPVAAPVLIEVHFQLL